MAQRIFNFAAGPGMLPEAVLTRSAASLVNYKDKGYGIAEVSHRGKDFIGVLEETVARARSVFNVSAAYDVIFMQGGATQQFATIPMNFLKTSADYVNTGVWAEKAYKIAKNYGTVNLIGSSEKDKYKHIPAFTTTPGADYLHICTNNTVYGSRFSKIPEHPTLIADMSSEIAGRVVDANKFAMIYAGAQKNLGPSGLVLVLLRKDMYAKQKAGLPDIFDYQKHALAESCLNTPPTFGVYMLLEMFRWIDEQGGVAKIEAMNEEKAGLVYQAIDSSNGYYTGHITDVANRSRMNITYTLPSDELTDKFCKQAEAAGMHSLKGYRTVGGIRASMYNAMPVAGAAALAKFMGEFAAKNPKAAGASA